MKDGITAIEALAPSMAGQFAARRFVERAEQ
jgi:hypothetical protein